MSLLDSEFVAEEFECGDDGIELRVEKGCDKLGSPEAEVEVWPRSLVTGSDGVWKVIGRGTSPGICLSCLRRRRHQKNTAKRRRRRPAHAPTAMPPIAPPLSLNEFSSVIRYTRPRGDTLTKLCNRSYRRRCKQALGKITDDERETYFDDGGA